jgi:uncharacterized protein involved in exopolysaccharide biosynthesis
MRQFQDPETETRPANRPSLFLDDDDVPPAAAPRPATSRPARAAEPPSFPAPEDGAWRDRIFLASLALAVRHRFLATTLVLVCAAGAAFRTLQMDPFYVATATIYPAASGSPLGSFGFAGIASLVGNLGMPQGGGSQFPIYESVIHSRELLEQLLPTPVPAGGSQRPLLDHLEIDEPDPALRAIIAIEVVRENLSYETDKKTGIVAIGYRDRDPSVAAAVANRVLELLNHFDISTSTGQASERRKFVEARLEDAKAGLLQAEARLARFSEENLRIGNAPDLLLAQARLQREVAIEQEVYLALRKEAEMARIDEQRSIPVVNVLDHAVAPPLPAGPSLVRNTALGGIVGVLLTATMFVVAAASPRRLLAQLDRIAATH